VRLLARKQGPTLPLRHADWLRCACTTTPANILEKRCRCVWLLLNVKYIDIVDDKINSWRSRITPPHSLTNKNGRRKEKARVPIRTRFLPSADSISDQSRASHLSHLITSLHAAVPQVVRHSCMSHHINRSICISSYACMCPSSVTMLLNKALQTTSLKADGLKPLIGVYPPHHRVL